MARINYKSDFDFILDIKDAQGASMGFPVCDFTVKIRNRNCWKEYQAWRKGDECHNCYNDGGRLHIVCDHHDLAPGRIEAEIHLLVPDSIYPDGTRLTVSPEDIGIELVKGKGDGEGTAAAEVTVRNLGAGTFSDMTLNYMIIRGDVVPTAVNGTFSNVNGSPKIMYCKPGLSPKSGTGWNVLKSWSVEDIANLPAYL